MFIYKIVVLCLQKIKLEIQLIRLSNTTQKIGYLFHSEPNRKFLKYNNFVWFGLPPKRITNV
jgi:hypothetical protein